MEPICRLCLSRINKICNVNNVQQQTFERITECQLLPNDDRPISLCYICHSQLLRCHRFYKMSQQAEDIFTGLLKNGLEITYNTLIMLNVGKQTNISITALQPICLNGVRSLEQVTVKEELNQKTAVHSKTEPVADNCKNACRVCLMGSVKMYNIDSDEFREIFETVTSIKVVVDGRPQSVCYICRAELRRCTALRDMSRCTALREMSRDTAQLTLTAGLEINNMKKLGFASLAVTKMVFFSLTNKHDVIIEKSVKNEPTETECHFISTVKPGMDFFPPATSRQTINSVRAMANIPRPTVPRPCILRPSLPRQPTNNLAFSSPAVLSPTSEVISRKVVTLQSILRSKNISDASKIRLQISQSPNPTAKLLQSSLWPVSSPTAENQQIFLSRSKNSPNICYLKMIRPQLSKKPATGTMRSILRPPFNAPSPTTGVQSLVHKSPNTQKIHPQPSSKSTPTVGLQFIDSQPSTVPLKNTVITTMQCSTVPLRKFVDSDNTIGLNSPRRGFSNHETPQKTSLQINKPHSLDSSEKPTKAAKLDVDKTSQELICGTCNKKFKYKGNLETHMRKHENRPHSLDSSEKSIKAAKLDVDKTSQEFICVTCNKKFKYKGNLERHMRKHENKPKASLDKQAPVHTGLKKFSCKTCNKRFFSNSNLQRHNRTHTGEKPYICSICNRAFTDISVLIRHLKIHNGDKPYACNKCDMAFSREHNLIIHLRTHTGVKPYKCRLCQRSFTDNNHLQRHMKTHAQNTCDVCFTSFAAKCILVRHQMKVHKIQKVQAIFICNECGKHFKKKRVLRDHMVVHDSRRPFSCDKCDLTFTIKSKLNRHMLTHTDIKPFSCDRCGWRCRTKYNLQRHKVVHDGAVDKPYVCNHCDDGFTNRRDMKKHIIIHQYKYIC